MTWDRVQEKWRSISGTTKQALGEIARSSYGALQGNNHSAEREKTNESLRTEREKTDQAVAAKQADVAKHADTVVDQWSTGHATRRMTCSAWHAKMPIPYSRPLGKRRMESSIRIATASSRT